MFFFGWGKKSKAWEIGDEMHLVVSWSYFDIFWCPIAFGVQWHLVGDKRSEDATISYEKVKELFPTNTPSLNIWQKYGLLLVIGGFVLVSLISNL